MLLLEAGGGLIPSALPPVSPSVPLVACLLSALCDLFTPDRSIQAQQGTRLSEDDGPFASLEHVDLAVGGSPAQLDLVFSHLYRPLPGGHRVFAELGEALAALRIDLTLIESPGVPARLVRPAVSVVRGDLALVQAGFASTCGQIARVSSALTLVGLVLTVGQVVLAEVHPALAGLRVDLPLAVCTPVPVSVRTLGH